MNRLITITLCLIALAYAAVCGALFVFQRSFIYYPQPSRVDTPLIRVPTGSDDGVTVQASVREHAGTQAVVYFGGNAEDVSQDLQPLSEAFPDHALYLLHYRGFGRSGGKPTEEAIQRDALALFDLAHQKHANVIAIGRSLGTGVAVRLASQRPVSRLVLVTPYDSLQELAVRQFPYFPVRWLITDRYESWKYVPQIKAPAHLIMAEHDEVIPRASTEQLFSRFAKGSATLSVIPGVSHNTVMQHPGYLRMLGNTP